MLEEVGEAGAPLRLGPDADVVDDRHADDRRAAVGRQHHPQAVVEHGADQRVRRRGQCRSGHAPTLTVFADRRRHRSRSAAAGPSRVAVDVGDADDLVAGGQPGHLRVVVVVQLGRPGPPRPPAGPGSPGARPTSSSDSGRTVSAIPADAVSRSSTTVTSCGAEVDRPSSRPAVSEETTTWLAPLCLTSGMFSDSRTAATIQALRRQVAGGQHGEHGGVVGVGRHHDRPRLRRPGPAAASPPGCWTPAPPPARGRPPPGPRRRPARRSRSGPAGCRRPAARRSRCAPWCRSRRRRRDRAPETSSGGSGTAPGSVR